MKVTEYHRGSWAIVSRYKYFRILRIDTFVLNMLGRWMEATEDGYKPASEEVLKAIKDYEARNSSNV